MVRRNPASPTKTAENAAPPRRGGFFRAVGRIPGLLWRGVTRALVWLAALVLFGILAYRLFDPPITPYMASESRRLGGVAHDWVPLAQIAPVMARSAVAAEDANFCRHWGFDIDAIRAAIEDGSRRGASTITQQVVKNVYLWHGRSWSRKAIEAGLTPLVEAAWPKRRILEVYLNVAEFGEGVFGVEAAARHHFGVAAAELTAIQAASLAAVLPSPKTRSAAEPSAFVRRRAAGIMDGAATIDRDGRAACFRAAED
jgi:monofunctional biosynthetic peptidoglycan transglycosylase